MTTDPAYTPAVLMKNCKRVCPERCTNNGDWRYLNKRNKPTVDPNLKLVEASSNVLTNT